jgi:hypothetical protein
MEELPAGKERRMTLRLLHYWRECCGDDFYPALSDIRGEDIPHMWPHCIVLDLGDGPEDPVVRFAGPEMRADCNGDVTHKSVSALQDQTLVKEALSHLPKMTEKRVPILMGGEYSNGKGARVLYRAVLLPLSDDGENLHHVLAAVSHREVAES